MDEHPPDGNERTVEALVCLRCGLAHAPAARECGGCGVAFDESTSVARRVPQPELGTIRLTGGRVENLDTDLVIGRNPTREPLGPHQRAVVHGEDDRTVSRRHILLTLDGWEVTALSLGRDTRLRRRSGAVSDLAVGASVRLEPGDTLHYGDNLSLQYVPSAAATAGSSSAGDRRAGSRGRRTRSTAAATPSKAAQAAPTGRDDVGPLASSETAKSSSEGPPHHDRPMGGGPGLPGEPKPGGASRAVRPKSAVRPWKLAALAVPIVLVGALVALAAFDGWFGNGPGGGPPPPTTTEPPPGGSEDTTDTKDGDTLIEGGTTTTTTTSATTTTVPEPLPPEEPTVEPVGGENRASANWSADDNGSSILEWEIDDGGMPGDASTAPNATSHTWTNVPAGTYTITVTARNAGGPSPPATTTVTVAQSPPDTPTIKASGGENRASANWSADDNGSPILEWQINDDGMPDGPGRTATSHEWAEVPAGTYTITVTARNAGGPSPPATATVLVDDPPPRPRPATPTIKASGGENRASANWSADDNGSPILEWEVNDDGMPDGPGRAATSHEWAEVPAGTYTITVRARNAGGRSQPATATVTVAQSPPAKPIISANGGENRASASWSADDNGSSILEWEIDDGGMPGDASTAPNATSHEWADVPAGTYTITVTARNAGGPSPPATKTVTVAQSPPDTPAVSANGGENRASASWSADDNGSSILEWEIDDGGMPGDASTAPNATSHEWADVPAGTYTITVTARNAGGPSPPATKTVTVAQSPPDTPAVSANGGENRASASWSADDNGSSILEWEIDDGGMPGDASTAPNETNYTWTNVPAGTYTITVRARNAGGPSPPATEEVEVTDPPSEPSQQPG